MELKIICKYDICARQQHQGRNEKNPSHSLLSVNSHEPTFSRFRYRPGPWSRIWATGTTNVAQDGCWRAKSEDCRARGAGTRAFALIKAYLCRRGLSRIRLPGLLRPGIGMGWFFWYCLVFERKTNAAGWFTQPEGRPADGFEE